ncbi:DUF4288 domain-containing protein [Paenibacillus sp. YN15]|uniref:DUF4288 domain-containing protein n=1 Tax=Paenibacillus sp. YN15 TaxID=1742774 RepID=UPI000DCD8AA7|nr:DUF4288 domain-containing protein [Paenibacillus sp. YN15]RAV05546.1 hypothetical protein DQG13_02685 [Paenibacillus sp. YN15]
MEQPIWFSAQLLFQSEVARNSAEYDTETYEESIVLIKAVNKEEAYQIAAVNGKNEESSYMNIYNEEVHWRFIKVVDLFELTEETIDSGTEVFSRYILAPSGTQPKEILHRYYQEE